jgi:hypothetical protein
MQGGFNRPGRGVSAVRRASYSRVVLVVLLVFSNTLVGCGTSEKSTLSVEENIADGQSSARMLSFEEHEAIMQDLLADARVRACEQLFAEKSLSREYASSFTLEGMNRLGRPARVTIMVFRGPDSSLAGLAAYVETAGETAVFPCVAHARPGESVSSGSASISLTEYSVSEGDLPELFTVVCADSLDGDGSGGGGKVDYWDCVGISAVSGTLSCTLKCLPTGPLYVDCLIACTGWSVVTALIGCAFAELYSIYD